MQRVQVTIHSNKFREQILYSPHDLYMSSPDTTENCGGWPQPVLHLTDYQINAESRPFLFMNLPCQIKEVGIWDQCSTDAAGRAVYLRG